MVKTVAAVALPLRQWKISVWYDFIITAAPEKNYLYFVTIQLQNDYKSAEKVTICNLSGRFQPIRAYQRRAEGISCEKDAYTAARKRGEQKRMKQNQTGARSRAPAVTAAALLLLAAVLCVAVAGIPLTVAALMFERSLPATQDAQPGTTAGQTASATAQEATNAAPASLTETPADLLALAEKYADLLGDGSGGKVKTVNYGKKGATDVLGSVMIKNTTETKHPDFAALLKQKPALEIDPSQPAVLIFHSHTSESYAIVDRDCYDPGFTAHSNDPAVNVVRVGDEIAHVLENAGYTVIHDTVIHDADYTGAYPHSRKTLEDYLTQYPQLQILLDIHRDSIDLDDGTKMRPVATVNGKQAAQLMIIAGAEEGKVTEFPHWESNLCFALQLQKRLAEAYPGQMRPLLFSQRKYNMDLTRCSLFIEVGSEGNTLEEACYSGRLLAAALAEMLGDYKK